MLLQYSTFSSQLKPKVLVHHCIFHLRFYMITWFQLLSSIYVHINDFTIGKWTLTLNLPLISPWCLWGKRITLLFHLAYHRNVFAVQGMFFSLYVHAAQWHSAHIIKDERCLSTQSSPQSHWERRLVAGKPAWILIQPLGLNSFSKPIS